MKRLLLVLLVANLIGCATGQTQEERIAEAAAWCGEFYTTDQDLRDCTITRFQQVEAENAAYRANLGAMINQSAQNYSNQRQATMRAYVSRPR